MREWVPYGPQFSNFRTLSPALLWIEIGVTYFTLCGTLTTIFIDTIK
jgi:hypothetical protein